MKGFKEFILRGSVVDLAVGVLVGGAFGTVVTALVKDLFTPFVSAIFKQPDFSSLSFTINGSQFLWGDFLNAIISFLIIAATIYFFVVLPINTLTKKMHKGPPVAAVKKQCPECLSDIPAGARRCAFCTAELPVTTATAKAAAAEK